jgi:hypothetical protein
MSSIVARRICAASLLVPAAGRAAIADTKDGFLAALKGLSEIPSLHSRSEAAR